MQAGSTARLLAESQAVLFIVYTPGVDAEANGYEPWLVATDNPFFNAIPGVHHYANWKIEQTLHGPEPGFSHFDFQGLSRADDLERVWFDPSLDAFRTEWIRLWGYGAPSLSPTQANAYLMHPVSRRSGAPTGFARVTAGAGAPPDDANLAWCVTETVRKHYASGDAGLAWRVPATACNPLGYDWLALRYGDDVASLAQDYRPGAEAACWVARLIAAP